MTSATLNDILFGKTWLSQALDKVAAFRETKAEEHPDDLRNVRSARALRDAAQYALLTPHTGHRSFELFGELTAASKATPESDFTSAPSTFSAPTSVRVASRYFFEDQDEGFSEQTHEQLFHDIYAAMLNDLSGYGAPATSPLGRYITAKKLTTNGAASETDEARLMRIQTLLGIAAKLSAIADFAYEEVGPDDRLPQLFKPTRIPVARQDLGISVTAFKALGGSDLPEVSRIANEEIEFRGQLVSSIGQAMDRVQHVLDAEGVNTAI